MSCFYQKPNMVCISCNWRCYYNYMHICTSLIFSQKDGVPRNVPTPKIYPPPLHYHVSFLGNNCQNRASFTHVSIFPFSHVNLRCVPFPQVYLDSRISPGRNWLSWWASVDTLPMCSSSNWLESEEFTLNSFICLTPLRVVIISSTSCQHNE